MSVQIWICVEASWLASTAYLGPTTLKRGHSWLFLIIGGSSLEITPTSSHWHSAEGIRMTVLSVKFDSKSSEGSQAYQEFERLEDYQIPEDAPSEGRTLKEHLVAVFLRILHYEHEKVDSSEKADNKGLAKLHRRI